MSYDTAEDSTQETKTIKPKKSHVLIWLLLLLGTIILVGFWVLNSNLPPQNFPVDRPLIIEPGLSAREIITSLAHNDYANSSTWLYLVLSFQFGAENIKAGIYNIDTPLTSFELAKLITGSAPPSATVSLTFPEGFSTKEYAEIAEKTLTDFDTSLFLQLSQAAEGKLFPDTYAVPPSFTAADLFNLLQTTYETKVAPLRPQMVDNKLTEADIINLASIIEREANTEESMRLVAGILDKRLALGMPLQADATMEYVLNKPLKELTADDLEIDTPYNTYLYKGLPPTPIGNPGLDSIMAVLEPKTSEYLFYLTDEEGEFHYAETYEEHQENITRYLQ